MLVAQFQRILSKLLPFKFVSKRFFWGGGLLFQNEKIVAFSKPTRKKINRVYNSGCANYNLGLTNLLRPVSKAFHEQKHDIEPEPISIKAQGSKNSFNIFFQKIQIQFSFGISRFIFFSFSALEGSGLLATLASGGQMDWQPATYICFSSSMVRLTKDLRSARTGNFKVGRYELLAS